jgi:hypothetical protein
MDSIAEVIAQNSKEKVPIGALLLADELILPQDLDFALDHQKYCRQLLGEILVNIGAMRREDLDKVLKLQKAG